MCSDQEPRPTPPNGLAAALRVTAERLARGASYQWGHFGACNCGHLAQTLTSAPREAIHRAALVRARDWGDAAVEYCPGSGLPLDHIIAQMLRAGLSLDDLRALEELSHARVVRSFLARHQRHPRRNDRADVVAYMRLWAEELESA